MCRKITSHWQPLFSKKMEAAASFSYKIGGGPRLLHFPTKLAAAASFSYKIGGSGKDLATLLAAVLTWSGYWNVVLDLSPECITWQVQPPGPKFYKVHFRASILARLSYQKSLKKLDWRVISKKNMLVRLTGASMRAICCVMSSTFHLKALITDK